MTHALAIVRRKATDYGTPGRATLDDDGAWTCDTLELPWFGNKKGISCIKADIYRAWLWYSPSFRRWVFRLEDKNGRADCLLHPGNWAGDAAKGLFTQVHGCTLIGRGYADVQLPEHAGGTQFGIINSRVTLDELIRQVGGDPTLLSSAKQPEGTDLLMTYSWEDGAAPEDDV